MRKTMLGLGLALLALPATVASASQVHQPSHIKASWYSCRLTVRGEQIESRTCRTHAMPRAPHVPLGWWIRRSRIDAEHLRSVRYPTFEDSKRVQFEDTKSVQSSVQSVAPVSGSYQQDWLVTYYLATGSPMANGIYPSVGWAACGYDVSLGTRVVVAGLGAFTCGDRIGYDPYHHIDIFGIPLGSGIRTVTIYP